MYRRVVAFGFVAAALAGLALAEEPPAYRPSPGSQPPVPAIRAAPPSAVADVCVPYIDLVSMARMGRERPSAPAFTREATTLTKTYFGAPKCIGSVSSEGGNSVNCPATGKEDTWAVRTMNQHVVAATACATGWRRSLSERYATFTSPDGTSNITVSRPDPAYGPMVDTTARYQPCEPLQEMMGLARNGRSKAADQQFTKTPTALFMRYYGASRCTAKARETAGSFAVSCVYPAADKKAAERMAKEGAASIQACQPTWTRSTAPQGAKFVKGDGIELTVSASSARQVAITMTFEPKAK
ncbi:MAG: hypothetical protein ACKVRO_03845 [Micropepsaceae bacterium]